MFIKSIDDSAKSVDNVNSYLSGGMSEHDFLRSFTQADPLFYRNDVLYGASVKSITTEINGTLKVMISMPSWALTIPKLAYVSNKNIFLSVFPELSSAYESNPCNNNCEFAKIIGACWKSDYEKNTIRDISTLYSKFPTLTGYENTLPTSYKDIPMVKISVKHTLSDEDLSTFNELSAYYTELGTPWIIKRLVS